MPTRVDQRTIHPNRNRSQRASTDGEWVQRLAQRLAGTSLQSPERQALAEFLAALWTQVGDGIEDVILYGSAARNEARMESDVDLLILTKRAVTGQEKAAITHLARECSGMYDCLLRPLLLSPAEQQWHQCGSSLWRNIQHDGIGLWQSTSSKMQIARQFAYKENPANQDYVMTEAQYDEIYLHLEHSREELETAEILIRASRDRKAILSCYYALFYAASALLLTKGMTRAKHSGVESALHRYFITPGLLSKEMGKLYTALHSERELADYNMVFNPEDELAEQRLHQAQEFVGAVRTYLIQNDYLSEAK